jgi:hypothetical protein
MNGGDASFHALKLRHLFTCGLSDDTLSIDQFLPLRRCDVSPEKRCSKLLSTAKNVIPETSAHTVVRVLTCAVTPR